jgi:hypothetical protein
LPPPGKKSRSGKWPVTSSTDQGFWELHALTPMAAREKTRIRMVDTLRSFSTLPLLIENTLKNSIGT